MLQMLRVSVFALTLVLTGAAGQGRAQEVAAAGGLPAVIERGLSRFQTSGGEVAVENWTRGGPLEKTKVESTAVSAVTRLEHLYGKYVGHSLIEQIRISPASELFYLEIELDRGPIYAKFHVFDGKKGPQVVGITIDAVPENILPPHVLEKMSRRE